MNNQEQKYIAALQLTKERKGTAALLLSRLNDGDQSHIAETI